MAKRDYPLVNILPLVEYNAMELWDHDGELVPGISIETTGGHTRDHAVVFVKSRGETACFLADSDSDRIAPSPIAGDEVRSLSLGSETIETRSVGTCREGAVATLFRSCTAGESGGVSGTMGCGFRFGKKRGSSIFRKVEGEGFLYAAQNKVQ